MEDGEVGPWQALGVLDREVASTEARVELTRSRVDAELLREDANDGDESDDDGENEKASHPNDPSLRGIGTVN
jgi:hypothetical protein